MSKIAVALILVNYLSIAFGLNANNLKFNVTDSVIFVSADARGKNDGSSWKNAYTKIQRAINAASNTKKTIWVAKGKYDKKITINKNVSLYGGFAGFEDSFQDRDFIKNETIINGKKQWRCLLIKKDCTVDGFIVEDGQVNLDINNYGDLFDRAGGGILVVNCNAIIRNNIFRFNAACWGGAIFVNGSPAKCLIEHNVITRNHGTVCAGGIELDGSDSIVRFNTIVDNIGFGLEIPTHFPAVLGDFYNNIVVGNITNGHPRLKNSSKAYDVWALARNCTNYSFVGKIWKKGKLWDSPWAKNNLYGDYDNLDVGFIDRKNMNYHLTENSPCIGVGKPNSHGSSTDIGAYPYIKKKSNISISGSVRYYFNSSFIKNAMITMIDENSNSLQSKMSNNNGDFSFSLFLDNSSCLLIPFKQTDKGMGHSITMFDAALTARFAIGLQQLSTIQQIAADVEGNDNVLFYDAALIAREAVGLPNLSNTFAGSWYFIPDTLRLNFLSHDTSGIQFTGIILGDVDGSWSNNMLQNYSPGKLSIQGFLDRGVIENGDTTFLLFDLPAAENILSFDLSINYPNNKKFLSFKMIPLDSDMNISSHDSDGCLRLGGYGTKYLKTDYQIAVYFLNSGPQTDGNFAVKRFFINNHSIFNNVIVNVYKMILDNNIPEMFRLYQNYPNPFNSATQIDYSITQRGYVSLTLYDIQGRVINTLFSGLKGAGHYQVNWNGKDQTGKRVSGGVYFLVLNFNNRMKQIIKINYLP